MLRLLLRPFYRLLRPPAPAPDLRLRAWYWFTERAIDDCNDRVKARLAAAGVDPTPFDLSLVVYEDFQRGLACQLLPGSQSLPFAAVEAALADAFAERHLETRAAAREWLGRQEEAWVLRGLGLKRETTP